MIERLMKLPGVTSNVEFLQAFYSSYILRKINFVTEFAEAGEDLVGFPLRLQLLILIGGQGAFAGCDGGRQGVVSFLNFLDLGFLSQQRLGYLVVIYRCCYSKGVFGCAAEGAGFLGDEAFAAFAEAGNLLPLLLNNLFVFEGFLLAL